MLRQTHFVEGNAPLPGIMQELLYAHVPLGGGHYLFEQMAADEPNLKQFSNRQLYFVNTKRPPHVRS